MPNEDGPLWRRYQDHFPVRKRFIYLNHAAVAPIPRRTSQAMHQLATEVMECGAVHYNDWVHTYDALRRAAGKLIDAAPDEIAIVKNTSEGIATIALGIPWRTGDKIVAFYGEFPANYMPWKSLVKRGVRVEWLSATDPLERIEEACRGARLLAISFVQYLSGFRADLKAIGEICERQGCFFFVDAIQGLGAIPLNVHECRIHALAADGHKWLLGPEGCGILFVRRDVQDEVEPAEVGWTNFARFADYDAHDLTFRPSAARYECGTLNTIGCYGLRTSLELILEIGIGEMAPVIQNLANRITQGVESKGYEVLGDHAPGHASGIVSFRRAGVDSSGIVRHLRSKGIIVAPRQGWVRASPHFYISPSEIDQMLAELPA